MGCIRLIGPQVLGMVQQSARLLKASGEREGPGSGQGTSGQRIGLIVLAEAGQGYLRDAAGLLVKAHSPKAPNEPEPRKVCATWSCGLQDLNGSGSRFL